MLIMYTWACEAMFNKPCPRLVGPLLLPSEFNVPCRCTNLAEDYNYRVKRGKVNITDTIIHYKISLGDNQ